MKSCGRIVAFALAILALSAGPSAAKVPSSFTIQGLLRDGQGKLQTMPVTVVINIFDADQMGNLLAGPYTQMVKADNGLFTVEVTDANLRSLLAPAGQVWIEVTVDKDTFPRRRVTAEVFALMAGSAEMADKLSPACSGCVDDSMIAGVAGAKVSGKVAMCTNADVANNANTVTNGLYSTGAYADPMWLTSISAAKINGAVTSAMTATNFTGMLIGDVTGTQNATIVQRLNGSPIGNLGAATAGQLLGFDGQKWGPTKSYGDTDALMAIALAGYLKKSDPIAASQLPPDGLDEVSNNLMTTTFNTKFMSTDTPVVNNPMNGLAQSQITVPDIGLVKTIQVSVNISDPDIGAFKVELIAPDNSNVILYDRGKPGQKDLVATYDHQSILPQGSLASYLNKHPTGIWTLRITNVIVGNNETLNSWNIQFIALSTSSVQIAGDLQVTSNLQTSTLNNGSLGSLAGAIKGQALVYNGTSWVPGGFGGTGMDGPLLINGGTTTIDLAGTDIFLKNYSTIQITGTGALRFANAAPHGTLIILKSRGDVLLTSTATPNIDVSGLGASTGTNGNGLAGGPSTGGVITTGYYSGVQVIASLPGRGSGIMAPTTYGGSPNIFAGAGGGGAGGYFNGGSGGTGGGGLYLECGGALTFKGSIYARGTNGGATASTNTPGTYQSGSGGGGGATNGLPGQMLYSQGGTMGLGGGGGGGSVLICASSISSNTGTIDVSGGSGGMGTLPGGAGGQGSFRIELNPMR